MHSIKTNHYSPFRIIIGGFLGVIVCGAFLLMLPISSQCGEWTSFISALFTSTSAVCVTGLVLFDTATYWSSFGQGVIILLIQIGGLGVVTVAGVFSIISGKRIGLMQRSTMQEAISAPSMGGIVRRIGFIFKTTLLVEMVGALLLYPTFMRDFGALEGIWYAIFHAISAFCNAGFDLMGVNEPFSSLMAYGTEPAVALVIAILIVIGGIGFLTWDDIRTNLWHFHRYRMQSKVIITVTAALIMVPTIYFMCFEFTEGTLWERFLVAVFQSVSPRTAGFNTTDLTAMSEAGQALMIVLMLVGGSPGSTAGGIKTTTLALLLANAFAVFHHNENPHFYKRRVGIDIVQQAATILMLYLVLFFMGGWLISVMEGLPMLSCLFETASAIGTVGLSLGLTPNLGVASQLILIILMFLGRVGGLTLLFAAFAKGRVINGRYPQEHLTVG
ncbi:MAG: potassium transporter TrkG [Peptococcaceae bacterium]